MTITEVPVGAKDILKYKDDPNSRTAYHLVVFVHPDYEEYHDDPVLVERYLPTRGFRISPYGDGALYVHDTGTGQEKIYPQGLYGVIECSEELAISKDGNAISDEDFATILDEMNEQAMQRQQDRSRASKELSKPSVNLDDITRWTNECKSS